MLANETFAIETFNLTKRFAQSKTLHNLFFKGGNKFLTVNNVNIQIKKGESYGLIGPNGAGKTTLLKLLCGFVLPTSGTAKVIDYDLVRGQEKIIASVGLVSADERSFYARLTGRQNLEFFASLYNIFKLDAGKKISALMDLLEIDNPDIRFQEYSAGIKQRFAIARCLLHDPEVIFMDEPTKNLYPIVAKSLRKFIRDELIAKQKKTVLFATQNFEEAAELADRLAIMDKGEIIAQGTIEELKKIINNPGATIEEIIIKLID